ncbi:hypothetical protein NDU88_001870 [Pleurodeles waltl]|uniref:Uncharacterized protein n=1 Tax=Pleurodeles waltl TaxID=8319 RepID=A0AAV7Q828_PLEWA|nr:hypothetical protein NDU88_001870 [Pleurodeles waltl]
MSPKISSKFTINVRVPAPKRQSSRRPVLSAEEELGAVLRWRQHGLYTKSHPDTDAACTASARSVPKYMHDNRLH